MARLDFDLYQTFGNRLVFGMSLPTLRNDLAKIYEPKAPAPSQRFATLQEAKAARLHVYVAIAPTYPECDEEDLRATLAAIAGSRPNNDFSRTHQSKSRQCFQNCSCRSGSGDPNEAGSFRNPRGLESVCIEFSEDGLEACWGDGVAA